MTPLPEATGLRATWQRLPPNARGAIWIFLGCVAWNFNDAVVKSAGRSLDPVQIAFVRYVMGVILLMPIFMRVGVKGLMTKRPVMHVCRVLIAAAGQIMIYYSVIHMMLADVTAINYSRPLFMTVLAVLILKEFVGWKRWSATAVGFVGVLIMVRPGQSAFDPVSLIAIGSAFMFTLSLIMVRLMAPTESPPRILFYYHVGAALLCAIPAILVWQHPTPEQWAHLMGVSVLTTAGMWCFVSGYSIAEASVVGPIEYVRLIFATLIGYFIFSEIPDGWTIAGAVIIVAAALYIAREAGHGGGGGG